MRIKIFAAFGFGFAAGMLCLAMGLLWTGRLPAARMQQTQVSLVAQPEPTTAILRNPPPTVSTPAPAPVELESSAQSARLAMPIAGIDPSKVHSNFDEMRGAHRHEALDIMAPRGTPVMAV